MQSAPTRHLDRFDVGENESYYSVLDAIADYSPHGHPGGSELVKKIREFDGEVEFDGLDTFPEGVFKTPNGGFEAVGTIFLKFSNGHPADTLQAIIRGRIIGSRAEIEDIDLQIPNA